MLVKSIIIDVHLSLSPHLCIHDLSFCLILLCDEIKTIQRHDMIYNIFTKVKSEFGISNIKIVNENI